MHRVHTCKGSGTSALTSTNSFWTWISKSLMVALLIGSCTRLTRPVTTRVLSVLTFPQYLTICLLRLSLAATTACTVLMPWRKLRKASFADCTRAFSTQHRNVISLSSLLATSAKSARGVPVGLKSLLPHKAKSPYLSEETSAESAASFFVRSASSRSFAAAFFSAYSCVSSIHRIDRRHCLFFFLLSFLQSILRRWLWLRSVARG
jgi:hypothetical protein